MSIWKRAARVARANLSDLAHRASSIGQGRSLEEMSDAELERELERRRAEHAARAARGGEASDPRPRGAPARGEPRAEPSTPGFLAGLSPQKRREVRQYYANLELPFGAGLDEVKQAYRRLMRQFHPDKFPDDPARRQLATTLSAKLTKAYNELRSLLQEHERAR